MAAGPIYSDFLLSFRVATGTSWSPLCGLKGVKPRVKFGERTWDCSPGHAGKDGPHLAMTEGSSGFSRAAAPVWGFTRGTTGSSGSLSCGAREVRSPCAWRGGARYCSRAMVGEKALQEVSLKSKQSSRLGHALWQTHGTMASMV